jgi:hypothetical protein
MTLPNQEGSPEQVLENQDFFRLFERVESPGDIWEIDSSTKAIYVGPDSDLAEIALRYFNRQSSSTTKMTSATVAVNGPFVGRLDSLLATRYPVTNQQARILVTPVDIVDPDYERPTGPTLVPARRWNAPINVDLICALKPLPSIPEVRADRTYRLPRVPFNNEDGEEDDGSTDIVIPIYGRRMVTVQFITPVQTAHVISFYIAALQPGQTVFPKFIGSVAKASQSVSDTDSVVFRASDQWSSRFTDGVTADPVMPTFSSTTVNQPLGPCKGQADLLIINIKPDYGEDPPAGMSMVDLFIKISDREE